MSGLDYRYHHPLSPAAQYDFTSPFTRILYLTPGQDDDLFTGELELADVSNAVPYEALSYTWGSASHATTSGLALARGPSSRTSKRRCERYDYCQRLVDYESMRFASTSPTRTSAQARCSLVWYAVSTVF